MSPSGVFTVKGRLILASASPRRRRFLDELGLAFDIGIPAIDESPIKGELPEDFVQRMSREKALCLAATNPESWVLGADTIVVHDKEILGKPEGADQAVSMLQRLSGSGHDVWTGFCLCRGKTESLICQAVCTKVQFIAAADDIIRSYVKTGEPLDKAGAYGIQGLGGFLVKKIVGSYSNVVGLPMAEVVSEMLSHGVIEPKT
ncbi:MAG: septum formation protein Maf [Proteobacteria bacterium]|nr:septum formation protein Maf [Pseudomonadota bacterium]MBU1708870.1 septum formation protein Maf [Pseudomonadota bacterium]